MSAIEFNSEELSIGPGEYEVDGRRVRVLASSEETDLSVPLEEIARTSGEGIEAFVADEEDRKEWESRVAAIEAFDATGLRYFDDPTRAGNYIRVPLDAVKETIIPIEEAQ